MVYLLKRLDVYCVKLIVTYRSAELDLLMHRNFFKAGGNDPPPPKSENSIAVVLR